MSKFNNYCRFGLWWKVSNFYPPPCLTARMVCLVPLVMSLHYIILICHFTSRHFTSLHITSLHITSHHITSLHITSHHFTSLHFTSLHITSLHITSYDIMVISDIMGHVGVMLWHLKGHRGDLPVRLAWSLHDLGGSNFDTFSEDPFWRPKWGNMCQKGAKMVPTSDQKVTVFGKWKHRFWLLFTTLWPHWPIQKPSQNWWENRTPQKLTKKTPTHTT